MDQRRHVVIEMIDPESIEKMKHEARETIAHADETLRRCTIERAEQESARQYALQDDCPDPRDRQAWNRYLANFTLPELPQQKAKTMDDATSAAWNDWVTWHCRKNNQR